MDRCTPIVITGWMSVGNIVAGVLLFFFGLMIYRTVYKVEEQKNTKGVNRASAFTFLLAFAWSVWWVRYHP